MKGRLIAIGDIHGCPREFEELLDKLELTKHDRVILLGDLVNRGPDSARVIALARAHARLALLGNHELRLLNYRKTGDPTHLKKSDYETLKQLNHKDWAYLSAMPLTFHDASHGIVLVHGGFLPHQPWRRQPARIVTRIQVVAKDGTPLKRAEDPAAPRVSRRLDRPCALPEAVAAAVWTSGRAGRGRRRGAGEAALVLRRGVHGLCHDEMPVVGHGAD